MNGRKQPHQAGTPRAPRDPDDAGTTLPDGLAPSRTLQEARRQLAQSPPHDTTADRFGDPHTEVERISFGSPETLVQPPDTDVGVLADDEEVDAEPTTQVQAATTNPDAPAPVELPPLPAAPRIPTVAARFGSLPTVAEPSPVLPAPRRADLSPRTAAPREEGVGRCGDYTLLKRLKLGGMAEVFLAKTQGVEGFEKYVAIKCILPHLASQPRFVQMFIDEAKLTVQLSHANIAQIYELGMDEDTYFMAMEYIPGRDVEWLFHAAARAGELLPLSVVCFIIEQVCEGLDHAHRRTGPDHKPLNIIHRDVSPTNILISDGGAIKLIDFGIAKAATNMQVTAHGVVKGKTGYMSPEQLRGDAIDRRTDIFAAGIVFHELLTGQRLFRANSDVQTIKNVLVGPIPPVTDVRPGIPADIASVLHRCLERDLGRRFPAAGDVSAALRAALVRHGLLDGGGELRKLLEKWGEL
ncbi:MAG: protein kinase [Myxococcota bacterium]